MRIFIVGMPASGKSYWGQALADRLFMPFFDLDEEIEKGEGLSIADIFNKYDESHFRILEKQYLEELITIDPAVVATGGGTPLYFNNMNLMIEKGLTIFLNPPLETIIHRIKASDMAQRPLFLKHEAELDSFIKQLYHERKAQYQRAHIELQQVPDSVDEILKVIMNNNIQHIPQGSA